MSDKVTLTNTQRDELISQYVEIVVDSMDMDSLIQYAHEQITNYVEKLSDSEIKEEIDNHDEELFDELVDNVTTEDNAPVIINLPEGTNLTRVIRSDDDYASKVDTLVDNMVASDDNLFTHDSEGC